MLYTYRFKDSATIEINQGMTDPPIRVARHPVSDEFEVVSKVITGGVGVIWKCDGNTQKSGGRVSDEKLTASKLR